jgi:hypothetical protein
VNSGLRSSYFVNIGFVGPAAGSGGPIFGGEFRITLDIQISLYLAGRLLPASWEFMAATAMSHLLGQKL